MKKPNGYELHMFKFLKGGGLSVKYEEETGDKTISNVDTHTIDSPKDVHPDFSNKVNELKPYFADVFGLRTFNLLMNKTATFTTKQKDAVKTLKTSIDKMNIELLHKIEIVSMQFVGEENSVGVVIIGKLKNNGFTTPLKTPVIRYNEDHWGFEEQIDSIVEMIEDEVEAYLFEGKCEAPDLFGENNGKKAETDTFKGNSYDPDLEKGSNITELKAVV